MAIDSLKKLFPDGPTVFIADQLVHLGSLLVLACFHSYLLPSPYTPFIYKPLVALGGFVATVSGAGFFGGKVARGIVGQMLDLGGLPNGGTLIGQLERALIFLLIWIDQAGGIGFLVAAKSILRFENAKQDRKIAEYVLIGTLLSFSCGIALSSVTRWAINLSDQTTPAPGATITFATNTVTITITQTNINTAANASKNEPTVTTPKSNISSGTNTTGSGAGTAKGNTSGRNAGKTGATNSATATPH